MDLELTARVTAGDEPVQDVVVELRIGWSPDGGISLGSSSTDADGVARLVVDGGVGPASPRGADAEHRTRYRAEVGLFQKSTKATESVCIRAGEAAFRFEP